MKPIIILCLASLPVLALDVDGNRLTLNEAEMKMCASGCKLISNADLEIIRRALQTAADAMSKGCRKGDLI